MAGREVPEVLSGAGFRWTHQRQVVLDVLIASQTHLDADQIYRLARRSDPRLSLSTVYRAVGILRRHGLVRELHLGAGPHRYECGPDGAGRAEHAHLICAGCGRVQDFTSPLLDRLRLDAQERYPFNLTRATVEINATCLDCLPPPSPLSGTPAELPRSGAEYGAG
jgi:Fur family ferric uptake transcriptional regulator